MHFISISCVDSMCFMCAPIHFKDVLGGAVTLFYWLNLLRMHALHNLHVPCVDPCVGQTCTCSSCMCHVHWAMWLSATGSVNQDEVPRHRLLAYCLVHVIADMVIGWYLLCRPSCPPQIKKKLASTYEKFEKKGMQLPEQLRQRAKGKLYSQNEDKVRHRN
jgi:hypothetical protein